MGALQRAPGEHGADAQALQLVGDRDGYACEPSSVGVVGVAADADGRAVARIDRGDGLVAEVIDIGDVPAEIEPGREGPVLRYVGNLLD